MRLCSAFIADVFDHIQLKANPDGIGELKSTIAEHEKSIAQQQQQIEGLTVGLRKVSLAVDLSKVMSVQVAEEN
jgi:uncharacterized coiled-coil protein SlyX